MGIIGFIVVLASVLGGYVLHNGKLHVLYQPTEYLIILGAALGGIFVMAPLPKVINLLKMSLKAVTYTGFSKDKYLELMGVLFNLFQSFRKDGPQAIEAHVENPTSSEIFKKSDYLMSNHHALDYLCDTLKVTLSADLSPFDVDDLLDQDLKAIHEEEHVSQHLLQQTAEALPGLGIVAAVLGVVITMGKLDQGTQTIGLSVAAALVGTFLGVLACYGFAAPLATKIENDIKEDSNYFKAIKAALVANQKGAPPLVCVDAARRTIPPAVRPSFNEMDEVIKKK